MDVVDVAEYEGAYTDITNPGYYLVQSRTGTKKGPGAMALKIPTLAVVGRKLICEYEILKPTIDDDGARLLIRRVLLDEFCAHFYNSQVDEIEYVNLRSNVKLREPFNP